MTEHDALLNIAAEVGYELMRNGAETYRVEESVRRIVYAYRAQEAEVFAVANCIILSITLEDATTITKQKRVLSRTVDLRRVEQLNDLCRRSCASRPPLEQIQAELVQIRQEKSYPPWVLVLSSAMAAGAFTLFFGGNAADGVCAFFIGALLQLVCMFLERLEAHSVFISIIGGGLIMMLAMLSVRSGLAQHTDKIVIGALMNLVPGVALMVSMRDFIAGDYFSGQLRLTEALMTATAIALGAGTVLAAF